MPLRKNFYSRLLTSAGCLLLLSACTVQGTPLQGQEEEKTPADQRAEKVLHDSEAPEIVETGALLPTERLLSTGVLDLGERDAPLTLLIFTEYHCNYCKEFNSEHLIHLTSDFVNKGSLRVQLASFPLQKYAQSENAAKAVICAAEQNKGLAMNNLLFASAYKDPGSALNFAKELGINTEAFESCMESEETQATIARHREWARSLGVQYVPTFFLNGEKFVGLPYYADLRGQIEEALRE